MSVSAEVWLAIWQARLKERATRSNLNFGRAAANGGGVKRVKVQPGAVTAMVSMIHYGSHGSERATITMPVLPNTLWNELTALLLDDGTLLAQMLTGTLPDDIEHRCAAAGLSLLPKLEELLVKCEYDGLGYFCKHVVGLCYKLGQMVADDLFVAFHLRGRNRQQLLAPFGLAEDEPSTTPLPGDSAAFWQMDVAALPNPDQLVPLNGPPQPLATLGNPPFWRGRESLAVRVTPTYQRVSDIAMRLLANPDTSEASDEV